MQALSSFVEVTMRAFYERPLIYTDDTGVTYACNHPVYDNGTLYSDGQNGLVVIQQRIDIQKHTRWGPIDPWLVDQIYYHQGFKELFDKYAAPPVNGLYPTMPVRQVMWTLRMKPMRREVWETSFDRPIL